MKVHDDPGFLRHLKEVSDKYFGAVCDRPYRHKNVLLSDTWYSQNGLAVYETLQKKNEIVVTDCMGFHWGINLGFNLNVAKNFGPEWWMKYGMTSDPCPCR